MGRHCNFTNTGWQEFLPDGEQTLVESQLDGIEPNGTYLSCGTDETRQSQNWTQAFGE